MTIMPPRKGKPARATRESQAGDCHVNRAKGNWKLPPYKPGLTGAKTGVSCAGCYASFTNDCSANLSDEHWLSKSIVLEVGTNGRVQVIWRQQQQRVVQASEFSERILCCRHNNALSRLDATAIAVFRTLDHYQNRPRQPARSAWQRVRPV